MNNRRLRTRVLFQTRVKFTLPGMEMVSSDSKDLSLTGVYFFTSHRPEAGSIGAVEIGLGLGRKSLTLKLKGAVVRTDEQGIGVRFLEMDPVVFVHLKNVLYYNTGNPEAVDAEIIQSSFDPESPRVSPKNSSQPLPEKGRDSGE